MEHENSMSKEQRSLLQMKNGMAAIGQMHQAVSKILRKKDRKSYEYIDDFSGEISHLIEKLGIFPYHIIWEYISEKVPGNLSVEENHILRDVTQKHYRKAPLEKNDFFDYPRDEYFRVPLTKKELSKAFIDYFKTGTPAKVFEIPLKPGYSHFNLPVFSENEQMPQWILTLVYREDNIHSLNDEGFFEFMEHLSQQIGMAWDKFQENIADKLLENIDYRLGGEEKTKSHSIPDQLKIIAEVLAGEIQGDWCAFFFANRQENTLKLETGNVDLESRLDYSLTDQTNIMVSCFTGNDSLRLFGRKRLEEIVKPENMKPIEKAIRKERKRKKVEEGKDHFTPYVLFEHALFLPIAFGTKRLGIITLFRAKQSREPEPKERFEYMTRPFSQFETHLLRKLQRHVFNILMSHDAVQRRMIDIRNIIAQVISPISASISSTDKPVTGDAAAAKITSENMYEKLRYVNALSRIAAQYVTNFEILLDIDTDKISLKRDKIADLRLYLINFARFYTPLIRPKCIHINVTRETPSNISLEVDRDLFDVVILNLIDNAIKYSFDPEDRLLYGLQAKPDTMEDKENILIKAEEDKNNVTITVSSYGVELIGEERKRIFDREFRGIYGPDRAKGTGIGLYLAKEIIEIHDGTIELVPNTPKHNTVFKITLPKRWTASTVQRVMEAYPVHRTQQERGRYENE